MKKIIIFGSLLLAMTGFSPSIYAEGEEKHSDQHQHAEDKDSHDDHSHEKKGKSESSHDSHDHGKEKSPKKDDGHGHDDEHGHSSGLEDTQRDSLKESHAHAEDIDKSRPVDNDSEDSHAHNDESKENHPSEGHEDHDDHGGSKFGSDKAIVEVKNDGELFKLSNEAKQVLQVKTDSLKKYVSGLGFLIPSQSVVYYQDKVGVFVVRNDWIQLVSVKVGSKSGNKTVVTSKTLDSSMELVTGGVPLLRVAHLEASGQGGQGHAH